MQTCGFTFRADSGTAKFDVSNQPAVPTTLKFDLAAIAGAPKGKRPINHPKSRASRALALQPKDRTSVAATTANFKFGFDARANSAASASNPLIVDRVDLPALEKTINSKTGLSHFEKSLEIPPTSLNVSMEITTLAVETKDPVNDSFPATISSRRDINEKDKASFPAFRNNRAEVVSVEDFPGLGSGCGPSNGEWTVASKGRTTLGEELLAKGDDIIRRGYRRVLGA